VTITPAFGDPSASASYCTDASTLRLGPEIDAVLPGISHLNFDRVNCDDGVQGPGEEGADCGFVCSAMCP